MFMSVWYVCLFPNIHRLRERERKGEREFCLLFIYLKKNIVIINNNKKESLTLNIIRVITLTKMNLEKKIFFLFFFLLFFLLVMNKDTSGYDCDYNDDGTKDTLTYA